MTGWGGPGAWWPLPIMMPLLIAAGVTMMIVMTRNGGLFRDPGPGRQPGHGGGRD